MDWLEIQSPCSPRDSQESSPTPQFKSINSSALSLLSQSNSHIHTWLESCKTVFWGQDLLRTECSSELKMVTFLHPHNKEQCFFFFSPFSLHCENLIEVLMVKLTKMWRTGRWGSLEILTLGLSTLSLQPFFNYSSDFPTPAWRFLLMDFCSGKLSLSVCISPLFEGSSLPCDLTTLMALWRFVDF